VTRFQLIIVVFIFAYINASSQITLRVEITDLRNNSGKVMFQLFDGKEKVITQEMGDINEKGCLIIIKNLKEGRYAVRFYHDENQNQVMETNLLGKPTEGYGFSNNVTGRFGPPSFEKWLFELKNDKTISLKTVY
jgi:uncharacterized protein (DUF2141 family)